MAPAGVERADRRRARDLRPVVAARDVAESVTIVEKIFDELGFVRRRLSALGAGRHSGVLTGAEEAEYRQLCLRELTLLATGPPPKKTRRDADRRRPSSP